MMANILFDDCAIQYVEEIKPSLRIGRTVKLCVAELYNDLCEGVGFVVRIDEMLEREAAVSCG